MTGDDLWVSHSIAGIGLTISVLKEWPLNAMSDAGATGIYQQVGDTTGIVFVRYGPEDTVDRYVARLGGMFTEVSIRSDTPVVVDGEPGRRVTVGMTAQGREVYGGDMSHGVTHRTLPEQATEISVVSFSHRGMWILAGYRMPEPSLERFRERLDHTLRSISLTQESAS